MRNDRGQASTAVRGPFDPVLRDPELLARFSAEAIKLSALETLEDVLRGIVRAARSLARADRAEIAVYEEASSDGGLVLWAGAASKNGGASLERPIVVRGRRYATLRVTTTRPSFRAEDEALVALLSVQAALAIETVSLAREEAVLGRRQSALAPAGRTASLNGTVREVGDVRIDLSRYEAFVAGVPVHLTLSEFRLLELLTEEPGRAYTRSEIVARLWGADSPRSLRVADSHVTRLRRKIERDPHRPERLASVRGVGYRLLAG